MDRLLFYGWQQSEIQEPAFCASKAGWSPIPGGYAEMLALFEDEERCLAIDKTAWDVTMPGWVVLAYLAVKLRQVRTVTPDYVHQVVNRFLEVVGPRAVLRLPDGRRLRQKQWGLMKSGWFLTLSLNSFAQAAQHELACLRLKIIKSPLLWAMGDDSLIYWDLAKDVVSSYMGQLAKTGCLIKHFKFEREFCGFRVFGTIANPIVNPLYEDKHKFNLSFLKKKVEWETTLSYTLIYALSDSQWIRRIHNRFDIPIGYMQRAWAKGLIELNIKFEIPDIFEQ